MLFTLGMATHDNDNFDPFSAIGLTAALIANRLRTQNQIHTGAETGGQNEGQQDQEGEREEIKAALKTKRA